GLRLRVTPGWKYRPVRGPLGGSTGAPAEPQQRLQLGYPMPDISPSMPRSRQRTVAVESLSVSPRVAGEMLGFGKTHVFKLLKTGELESYLEGTARRILTASIHSYVARKVAASKPDKS